MDAGGGEVDGADAGAFRLPTLTLLSEMVNEKPVEFSSVSIVPLMTERVTVTLAARMSRLQLMVWASMTVLAAVMVHGPL